MRLTPSAIEHIKKFRTEASSPTAMLRISVIGGGCSGLQYKMDFEAAPKEGDKVFEGGDLTILVDPKSYVYIQGMTIHYSSGLNGQGFEYHNPNATKFCGCGTSFSL